MPKLFKFIYYNVAFGVALWVILFLYKINIWLAVVGSIIVMYLFIKITSKVLIFINNLWNKNGFTLIELLVVVAIIGILAAVGVVAYNGYTSAAKKSVAKTNQKNVVRWLAAEAQKCQLGVEKVLNDQVTCSSISSSINSGGNPAGSTVLAIERALKGKYKNPYGANYAGFGDEGVKEGGWGNERDLGYVLLNAGGDTGFFRVSVSVCYQLPCSGDKWSNPGTNVVVDIYKWYP